MASDPGIDLKNALFTIFKLKGQFIKHEATDKYIQWLNQQVVSSL